MLLQLALEDATALDKEAAVDGLVRYLHLRIARIRHAEPVADLLRRPLCRQFSGNDTTQSRPRRESAGLRTTGACPRTTIRAFGSIGRPPTVTAHLSADRGRRTAQGACDGP